MSLRAKVEQLNKSADMIRELIRGFNIRAADLNGVVAIIPDNAPFPASRFSGCKVILRNVAYDYGTSNICASVTFPHANPEDNVDQLSGGVFKVTINKNWFE